MIVRTAIRVIVVSPPESELGAEEAGLQQTSGPAQAASKRGAVWKSQGVIRLMDKILHDPKDPKLWEL